MQINDLKDLLHDTKRSLKASEATLSKECSHSKDLEFLLKDLKLVVRNDILHNIIDSHTSDTKTTHTSCKGGKTNVAPPSTRSRAFYTPTAST